MRRTVTALAVLALVLAGCGDDDDEDAASPAPTEEPDSPAEPEETDPPAEPEEPAASGEDGAEGDGASVTIAGFAFDPAALQVAAGTAVTWTNDDDVGHTVTAGTPDAPTGEFDERLGTGEEAEVPFAEPGTYDYFCAIHPSMVGQVVVS